MIFIINFNPRSSLAFLIAASFVVIVSGISLQNVVPEVASSLMGFASPIFYLGIAIWLVFVALSIGRNILPI